MDQVIEVIRDFFQEFIISPFTRFGWRDALDIAILAVLMYGVYLFFRGRRAGKFFFGIVAIFLLYALSALFELQAARRIFSAIAQFSVILLAIIFQPELRAALEKLGHSPLGFLSNGGAVKQKNTETIAAAVEAALQIAARDTDGALIVIEGNDPLTGTVDAGSRLDALVSVELLSNIFVDRSPLHDGAVVISNNRIAAAGCILRLTERVYHSQRYGTRHRAAIGVSEENDCVVIVVSQERHIVSLAHRGELKLDYQRHQNVLSNNVERKALKSRLCRDIDLLLMGKSFGELENYDEGGMSVPIETSNRKKGKNLRSRRSDSSRARGNDKRSRGLDEVVESALPVENDVPIMQTGLHENSDRDEASK